MNNNYTDVVGVTGSMPPNKDVERLKKNKLKETNTNNYKRKLIVTILKIFLRILGVLTCLYIFVCSLELMSSAFRLIGGRYAGKIFSNSSILQNPITGLMIGILVTILVQSSSTSTSIVVSMVASELIKVRNAIPIIMGTNIGTSITSTLVSLSQVKNREQFRLAYAGATVHDIFNFLSVLILLPLEVVSGYLETITGLLVKPLIKYKNNGSEIKILSLLSEPLTQLIIQLDSNVLENIANGQEANNQTLIKHWCNSTKSQSLNKCKFLFESIKWPEWSIGLVLVIISLLVLSISLLCLVKMLTSLFHGRISKVVSKVINAQFPGCFAYFTGYFGMFLGTVLTIIIQSSSVFTSTLTPLVGIGLVSLERVFPLILGSNIGTTITGILAALSGPSKTLSYSLQIALCHTLFNITGILIWYPIPKLRNVPLSLATKLGNTTAKYRWFAIVYILLIFVLIPLFIFGLAILGKITFIIVISIIGSALFVIFLLNFLQNKIPQRLPFMLQTWNFLPVYLRSIEPYDILIKKYLSCLKCCQNKSDETTTETDEIENIQTDTDYYLNKQKNEKNLGELVNNVNGQQVFIVSKLYSIEILTRNFKKEIL